MSPTEINANLLSKRKLPCVIIGRESPEMWKIFYEARYSIFVDGLKQPYNDVFDENDPNCVHVGLQLIENDGSGEWMVGTCRLRLIPPFIKLERMGVREECRGLGFGRDICKTAIRTCERDYPELLLVLHARLYVKDFYESFGFIGVSDLFMEVGIKHLTMIYPPRYDRIGKILERLSPLEKTGDDFASNEYSDPNVVIKMRRILADAQENATPRLSHYQFYLNDDVIGLSIASMYTKCAFSTFHHDFERSEKLESFLVTFAWEKLNTGHYAKVDDAWRYLYSVASTCRAFRLYQGKQLKEALHTCDKALMMGGDVDNKSLSAFASYIHSQLPTLSTIAVPQFESHGPRPIPNSKPIRILSRPSIEEFCRIFQRNEPVVLTDVITDWPAINKWSFDHMNKIMGYRTVPIEIGSSYSGEDWKQQLMTVSEFMSNYVIEKNSQSKGYLAQHRLFDQIPELLDDIRIPEYCLLDGSEDAVDLNIWLGPADTISPLHSDPKSNVFCQVKGRKFLRLVPYSDTDKIYAYKDGFLTNTSQVDVENPDIEKFPLFGQAEVFDCVLSAGDCLFIPKTCWHYVRSLDPSISVSCWFNADLTT